MSFIYRCMSCRTRNTWPKPVSAYVRGRRCRHCNHSRFYPDKERTNRKGCNCMAYHHPHRPGSGACGTHVDALGYLVKQASAACPF